jgi:hypothetical protein
MAYCHDAEASPVYATCQEFSPNSYAELFIHRLALKKKLLWKNCLTVQEHKQHALEV